MKKKYFKPEMEMFAEDMEANLLTTSLKLGNEYNSEDVSYGRENDFDDEE